MARKIELMKQIAMKNKKDVSIEVLGGVILNDVKLPLYSSRPQAGFPAPGDDYIEKVLDINDLVVKHPASTFFVRVEGDSMEGAGIFSHQTWIVKTNY